MFETISVASSSSSPPAPLLLRPPPPLSETEEYDHISILNDIHDEGNLYNTRDSSEKLYSYLQQICIDAPTLLSALAINQNCEDYKNIINFIQKEMCEKLQYYAKKNITFNFNQKESYKNQIRNAEAELKFIKDTFRTKIQPEMQKNAQYAETVKKLEKSLKLQTKLLDQLNVEYAKKNSIIRDLTKEIETSAKTHVSNSEQLLRINENFQKELENRYEIQQKLAAAEQEVQRLQNEIQMQRDAFFQRDGVMQQCTSAITQKEREIEELKANYNEEINKINSENQRMSETLNDLLRHLSLISSDVNFENLRYNVKAAIDELQQLKIERVNILRKHEEQIQLMIDKQKEHERAHELEIKQKIEELQSCSRRLQNEEIIAKSNVDGYYRYKARCDEYEEKFKELELQLDSYKKRENITSDLKQYVTQLQEIVNSNNVSEKLTELKKHLNREVQIDNLGLQLINAIIDQLLENEKSTIKQKPPIRQKAEVAKSSASSSKPITNLKSIKKSAKDSITSSAPVLLPPPPPSPSKSNKSVSRNSITTLTNTIPNLKEKTKSALLNINVTEDDSENTDSGIALTTITTTATSSPATTATSGDITDASSVDLTESSNNSNVKKRKQPYSDRISKVSKTNEQEIPKILEEELEDDGSGISRMETLRAIQSIISDIPVQTVIEEPVVVVDIPKYRAPSKMTQSVELKKKVKFNESRSAPSPYNKKIKSSSNVKILKAEIIQTGSDSPIPEISLSDAPMTAEDINRTPNVHNLLTRNNKN